MFHCLPSLRENDATVPHSFEKGNLQCNHKWAGGKGGDSPLLRVKNPPPTLRPKIGYFQRKFLILPLLCSSEAKNQAFSLKKCPNGAKKAQKSLCDPKFYPSPRAILGGASLFEAFFPPSGKKSVPMCECNAVTFWEKYFFFRHPGCSAFCVHHPHMAPFWGGGDP